jgi:hypothetical protein
MFAPSHGRFFSSDAGDQDWFIGGLADIPVIWKQCRAGHFGSEQPFAAPQLNVFHTDKTDM